eukprot:6201915-Pleurochrysis_carterae.AAC.7
MARFSQPKQASKAKRYHINIKAPWQFYSKLARRMQPMQRGFYTLVWHLWQLPARAARLTAEAVPVVQDDVLRLFCLQKTNMAEARHAIERVEVITFFALAAVQKPNPLKSIVQCADWRGGAIFRLSTVRRHLLRLQVGAETVSAAAATAAVAAAQCRQAGTTLLRKSRPASWTANASDDIAQGTPGDARVVVEAVETAAAAAAAAVANAAAAAVAAAAAACVDGDVDYAGGGVAIELYAAAGSSGGGARGDP